MGAWGHQFMAAGAADTIKRLKDALSNPSDIGIVLGAGASIALTEDVTLSWPGFLVSMIDHALTNGLCTPAQQKILEGHKQSLSSGKNKLSLSIVADDISRVYRADRNVRLYEGFLNERVANLKLKYSSTEARHFLETIARLNCPILTTNYDDIFERGLGIRSLTLDNVSCAAQVLRQKEQCVIHLHGIYSNPNSIVLTERDYKKLITNESWRSFVDILKNKILIFVGFGSSMFDSAFKVFRQQAFSDGPKIISHWHWLLSGNDRAALDKAIRAAGRAGERLPN